METFKFEFETPSDASVSQAAVLVGVVGSGNAEVLIEPNVEKNKCHVHVNTSASGFGETWKRVISDFVERNALGGIDVYVNDGGASPAVISLRLDQAAAEYKGGQS